LNWIKKKRQQKPRKTVSFDWRVAISALDCLKLPNFLNEIPVRRLIHGRFCPSLEFIGEDVTRLGKEIGPHLRKQLRRSSFARPS
jgi:hypothetical protein